MYYEHDTSKPFLFGLKKWILIVLCSLNIILMIVYASISSLLADRYLYDYEDFEPYRIDDAKMWVILILSLISVFSISFSVLGIIAAFRESFTMILVFTIIQMLTLGATIANSIHRPYYIPCAIWSIFIAIDSVLLTRDLHQINTIKRYGFGS
ncbi:hypothetical protein QR98_0011670 [Sarcoptes scabiei]|uniref:Uncharacterized protein n=1 Tax=Sarcoptes scabiei TaxID=52283 RepID=A0A131ZV96_SARSC|nr:hypothetical protein QR98_0011670 [Sarcoptes scabiei]